MLGATLSLGYESPSDSQGLSLADFPAMPVVQDLSKDSPQITHNAERGCLPLPRPSPGL